MLCWVFLLLQGQELLVVVLGLLTAVVLFHGAQPLGTRASTVVAPGLGGTGSAEVTHGFRCSMARGIFPGQGLDPCISRQIL